MVVRAFGYRLKRPSLVSRCLLGYADAQIRRPHHHPAPCYPFLPPAGNRVSLARGVPRRPAQRMQPGSPVGMASNGSSRSWGSSPRERHVQLIRVITRNLLGFRPALVFFRLSYCLFDHIGLIDVRANRFLGDILHRACAPSKYFGRYAFWWIGFHLSDYSKHLPMGSIGG